MNLIIGKRNILTKLNYNQYYYLLKDLLIFGIATPFLKGFKQLQDKFTLLKDNSRSFPRVSSEETLYQNLVELNENEYNLIFNGITEEKKEIIIE